MSDFLLEKICTYLRKEMILVKFDKTPCLEQDLYYISIYNTEGEDVGRFRIERCQMDMIKFVAKIEKLQGYA